MGLSALHKTLWNYLCDNCDNAGVWNVNHRLAEFEIGCVIDWPVAMSAFGDRIRSIQDGERWYLTKFLRFQYQGGLSPRCRPHLQIQRLLVTHGLDEEWDRHTQASEQTPESSNEPKNQRVYSARERVSDRVQDKTRQDGIRQDSLNPGGGGGAADESDPFPVPAAAVTPVVRPPPWPPLRSAEDEWRFGVGSEPWARSLVAAGAKIGPKNWPRWKAILGDFSHDQVVAVVLGLPAHDRWPDRTETALARSRGQAPTAATIANRRSTKI